MKSIVVNLANPGLGDPLFYERWSYFGSVLSFIPQELSELNKVKLLIVDQYTGVDRKFISKFPNLKIIATPTTGLTHIEDRLPVRTISLKGERVFLNKITSVSEFTVMSILKLAKDISNPPQKIAGKTIGIVGLGRLGHLVRKAAKGLGMRILYYEKGMDNFALDHLLATSHFVTLHCDENPTTKNLISRERIALMRPTSFLINTSRPSVLDEPALMKALSSGRIAGAALDTSNLQFGLYNPQPKNLIITPHIAGRSIEDRVATCNFLVNKVKATGEFPHGFEPIT